MKRKYFLIALLTIFIAEIIALVVFATKAPEFSQDSVAVNEAVKSVERDFPFMDEHINSTALNYVVLDGDGKVVYATRTGLSESVAEAVRHRDTLLDINKDGVVAGKIIIYNDLEEIQTDRKNFIIIILSIATLLQFITSVLYAVYLNKTIVKPFSKLKGFAERVAVGNLDIPLEMDRHNLFGAFTESFDIMRSELKKARLAEAQAQQSKKELVAKLSHDIKTPVASIKAVSEVGLAVTANEKDKANYTRIIIKADQINTLVTNLFTATLEELQKITVKPTDMESRKIKTMLENADYLHRADIPDIPECLAYADGLRLQQVFDNIFANSYKYADTEIFVTAEKSDGKIIIAIEDRGGGVPETELATLKEKFKRGSNSANTEGAGLGLYISDYFMREMNGELNIKNGARGLKATVIISLSGKN